MRQLTTPETTQVQTVVEESYDTITLYSITPMYYTSLGNEDEVEVRWLFGNTVDGEFVAKGTDAVRVPANLTVNFNKQTTSGTQSRRDEADASLLAYLESIGKIGPGTDIAS